MDEQTITVKELRQALFFLENQEMTVRELRQALFQHMDDDNVLFIGFGMFRKMEEAVKAEQARQARLEAMS